MRRASGSQTRTRSGTRTAGATSWWPPAASRTSVVLMARRRRAADVIEERPLMENDSAEAVDLIERARAGDREALGALLARYRDRLRRMVELRLDTRLQARLD